jgi:hypothetical protein
MRTRGHDHRHVPKKLFLLFLEPKENLQIPLTDGVPHRPRFAVFDLNWTRNDITWQKIYDWHLTFLDAF